ncbi:MAG TPA: zinc finger Ran-binding domain-containing protein [Pyrinomonadaceae bacterium]|nr:zinc finger Ran-binding domain-containing protein [Pyrinomonadaceae bacterium]
MSPKCPRCGLINFASAETCKRCEEPLGGGFEPYGAQPYAAARYDDDGDAERRPRSILRRVLAGFVAAAVLLFVAYLSMLATSRAADYEQRQAINRAIDLIERAGFSQDAFLLRRLASYRTTDNWWNSWVGHADAYAATNFPFQIVTLYPEFFENPTDDIERAVILLHEARHLAGAGEESAFASVWRDKARLGYTRERYGRTKVYLNVLEFTMKYAPEQFSCGKDGRQDCVELSATTR